MSLLSVSDNTGGIYAKPIQKQIKALIQKNHQWRYVKESLKDFRPFSAYAVFNNSLPKGQLKSILSSLTAEASIVVSLFKTQAGLSLTLNLYLKSDQKLLLQERIRDFKYFEIKKIQAEIKNAFKNLMSQLPYRALILSRQGDSITVNLGKKDGMEVHRVFSVIQILKILRHPKFDFLVHAENQVLGKIELIKVDETLSFGHILMEKEHGLIQKNSKIANFIESMPKIQRSQPTESKTETKLKEENTKKPHP